MGGSRSRMRRTFCRGKNTSNRTITGCNISKRDSRITLCSVSASVPETSIFDALRISKLGPDYGREPPVILIRF